VRLVVLSALTGADTLLLAATLLATFLRSARKIEKKKSTASSRLQNGWTSPTMSTFSNQAIQVRISSPLPHNASSPPFLADQPLPPHLPSPFRTTLRYLLTYELDISCVPTLSFFEWLAGFSKGDMEEKLRWFSEPAGQVRPFSALPLLSPNTSFASGRPH
jgi:hypothetical protein